MRLAGSGLDHVGKAAKLPDRGGVTFQHLHHLITAGQVSGGA